MIILQHDVLVDHGIKVVITEQFHFTDYIDKVSLKVSGIQAIDSDKLTMLCKGIARSSPHIIDVKGFIYPDYTIDIDLIYNSNWSFDMTHFFTALSGVKVETEKVEPYPTVKHSTLWKGLV